MLTRAQKQEQIDTLRGMFTPANGLFVMDFTGLSVGEVTELRRKVKEAKGNYRVVRNTLAKLALAETDHRGLQQLLAGPAAVAYTDQDAVTLAKALADFAETHRSCASVAGWSKGSCSTRSRPSRWGRFPPRRSWWRSCCSCSSRRCAGW